MVYLVRLQYNPYESRILGIASDLAGCAKVVGEYLAEYPSERVNWQTNFVDLLDEGYTIHFEEATPNKFMKNW